MNFASTTIMPLLARLVIAAAMLTSGWMNCFGQVQIRPEIVDGLRAMDIEVREQVIEPASPEVLEDGETTTTPVTPIASKPTTRGVNRIVWLVHEKWPELGGWGTFIAWGAAIAQLAAGVLLFVGLFTRWAALAIGIATGMAMYIVSANLHGMFSMNPFDWPQDSHRFIQLFAGLGLFTLSLGLLFGGGGAFSIDQHHSRGAKMAKPPKSKFTKNSIE
jgi:uncharacterized membrane protein YphA (DoxX/SURF4 family)